MGSSSLERWRRWARARSRREEFSLDKKIAERGMGRVGLGVRQHDFGVAGQLNLARARRVVRQRNAPHFGVVFGETTTSMCVTMPASCARSLPCLRKTQLHTTAGGPHRLIPGGPDRAAADVAQIDESAPVVSRYVFAPARDRISRNWNSPPAVVIITL
jgi:hypothetical protein